MVIFHPMNTPSGRKGELTLSVHTAFSLHEYSLSYLKHSGTVNPHQNEKIHIGLQLKLK